MKPVSLPLLALQARLMLRRLGWFNCIAAALLLAALCALVFAIPWLKAQTDAPLRSLENANRQLQAPDSESSRSQTEQRLAAFYDLLGDSRYAEQQVKTLFAAAAKTGLSLTQGEYKSGYDRNGRLYTYQVILPVKGSYAAIRKFCEEALLAIPFASLDEISFKRDAINTTTLEARLRITLYLAEPRAAAGAIPAAAPVKTANGGRS